MKKGIESHKTLSENFYKFDHETQEGWYEDPNGFVLRTLHEDYRWQEKNGAKAELRFARTWGKRDKLASRKSGHFKAIFDEMQCVKTHYICKTIANEHGCTMQADWYGDYVQVDSVVNLRIYILPMGEFSHDYGNFAYTHWCEQLYSSRGQRYSFRIVKTPAAFLAAIKEAKDVKVPFNLDDFATIAMSGKVTTLNH